MKSLLYCFTLVALLFATSCVPHKEIAYLQDVESGSDVITNAEKFVYKIQPSDLLSISISSLNQEADRLFKFDENGSDANFSPSTYMVDSEGNIELPMVGKIKVSGASAEEARTVIRTELDKYLKSVTVNVRLLNFQITVLGEVTNPGVYNIPNGEVNFLEAIGMAGDLTIFGKRDRIVLVREVDGKREYHRIDLTSKKLFEQPVFALRNKDVIYVEPSKGRTSSDDNVFRILPLLLSGLTFLTVIVNTFAN